jgi:hypothetical protein
MLNFQIINWGGGWVGRGAGGGGGGGGVWDGEDLHVPAA